jgi:hypothetical protein
MLSCPSREMKVRVMRSTFLLRKSWKGIALTLGYVDSVSLHRILSTQAANPFTISQRSGAVLSRLLPAKVQFFAPQEVSFQS